MSLTYLDAIRSAQARALAEDDSVYIYGQDVAGFGGAFKATKHLAERFPGRVIDAPISEDAMIGSAIGAAIEGMRPIIEMQFADFSLGGLQPDRQPGGDPLLPDRGSLSRRCAAALGGTEGSGPFHSQSLESIYAHYPGLIVMTPATVEDAYSMLLEAVAIDDPVIFCEHKFLYYHLKADSLPTEPAARRPRPHREAGTARHGGDQQRDGARVAQGGHELTAEGWDIEVVDLRTVKPIDTDTMLGSVARTGRLLCVCEGFPWGGMTAEVISRVVVGGFPSARRAAQRLNCRDTPIPYHPNLWRAHRPTSQSISDAIRSLLQA